MASRYGLVEASSGWISALNREPGPPVPVARGSPPWIMNPLITRWKTVPTYRRSLVRLPLRGSVHSRLPSASSTKLATVFGAWLGNSCRRMSPWLVDRVAYRSSATALLGGLVSGHAILAWRLVRRLETGVGGTPVHEKTNCTRRSPVFRSAPEVTVSKERLVDTWGSARTTLAPHLSAAREAVTPYVDQASARVAPVLDEARSRVLPAVETARDRLGPTVDTARTRLMEDVVPTVTAAVETARENSAPARAEAKERAAAALLALQGKQRKVRRWPTALVCLAAGAAAGIAAGVLTRGRQAPPPPTPFPTPNPTRDQGQSSATTPGPGSAGTG